LAENVRAVRARIAAAAAQCGRNAHSVTIVAASKSQPLTAIEAAARAGIAHFGESYLQEALHKLAEAARNAPATGSRTAAEASPSLTWHFIGQLQANKTRAIAEHFDWVHSVDRLRLAQRLSAQRPYYAAPLNVCIQVNVAGEASKAGVVPQEAQALVAAAAELPRLRVRGLMCLPPAEEAPERQRHWFRELRHLFEELNDRGASLDTLSMGMSADLEAAVAEGATMVRIGTALFGPRPDH